MADINDLIARGPPSVDFKPLGDLAQSYWQGQQQAHQQANQDAFKNGVPRDKAGNIDYGKIFTTLLEKGGAPAVGEATKLGLFGTQQGILNGPGAVSGASNNYGPPSTSRTSMAASSTPGDFGSQRTITSLVLPRVNGDENAGRAVADSISQATGVHPDEPLTPETLPKVLQAAQAISWPPRSAQSQPQAADRFVPRDPTYGGLAPSGNAPVEIRRLRDEAARRDFVQRGAGQAMRDQATQLEKAMDQERQTTFQSQTAAREHAIGGETGKAMGGQVADYIDQGRSATKRIQQLDIMRDALERGKGQITTGPFAETTLKAKQAIGSLFGWDVEGTTPAEVAQKVQFGLATQSTKELTSRPAQMEFLKGLESTPGILLSPKGSMLMLDILRQGAMQDRELAKLAADPRNHANWGEVSQRYYDTHPLYSPFDRKRVLGAKDLAELQGSVPAQPRSNVIKWEKGPDGRARPVQQQ